MPTRFKDEFRQNYRHAQGMFSGAHGAFVDLRRCGGLVWHRYSCPGLGGRCSLKSSRASPQIDVGFVLKMALFPMPVSSDLSRFGCKYPDIIACAWFAADLVSCCSGHAWERAVLGVRAFPAWGESSVHLCTMLLLSR